MSSCFVFSDCPRVDTRPSAQRHVASRPARRRFCARLHLRTPPSRAFMSDTQQHALLRHDCHPLTGTEKRKPRCALLPAALAGPLPLPRKTSFNISLSVGLLATNCLNFCLYKNIFISCLFLKNISLDIKCRVNFFLFFIFFSASSLLSRSSGLPCAC